MSVTIQTPEQAGPGTPLWIYTSSAGKIPVQAPEVEIDGRPLVLAFPLAIQGIHKVTSTVSEHIYTGKGDDISLTLFVRIAETSPIVRFRYELASDTRKLLTKSNGEHFHLLHVPVTNGAVEVRLSDFNSMVHSYVPTEVALHSADFDHSRPIMGPIVVLPNGDGNALLAYEHGSQYPDAYLHFLPKVDSITLSGAKATYLHGTDLQGGFQTVWMHLGAVLGR